MRKLYLLFILGFAFSFFHGQTWTWTTSAQVRDGQKRICRDATNNIYLFKNYNFYSTETDTIKKITPSGTLLFQFTLPQNTQLTNLVAAADTGFYLAGTYYGTVTISNQTIAGNESINIWFAKYNSSGTLQWIRTLGSNAEDGLGDICVAGNTIILTGTLGDTAYFMGQQFPKAQRKDLFVASFDHNGSIQAMKCATSLTTQTIQNNSTQNSQGVAWGLECEADASGNIYILAEALGKNVFDSDTIGVWPTDPMYPELQTVLLKLNSNLTLQFKHLYGTCGYCSSYYDNLTVSSIGESYIAYHYSYGQSGNDIQTSAIYHVSPSGIPSGTFTLRPDMRSDVSDLDIDPCGNLYFTGYWYSHWGEPSFFGSGVVGELDPQAHIKWILNDSVQTTTPRGVGICKIGTNEYFINGYSTDTITNNQGVFPGGNTYGFFAKVMGPDNGGCNETESIPKQLKNTKTLSIYPNPSKETFFLPDNDFHELSVYNSQGMMLLHQALVGNSLSLSGYPEGVYFIRITNRSGQQFTSSVVIAK